MHEGGHWLAVALEESHDTALSISRQGGWLTGAVKISAGRIGPVQDRERGVTEGRAQPPFELARRVDLSQFDYESTCRRLAHLRPQLAGHEADGHDPVLLGGAEESLARPLSGRVILERHLVEARKCISDVWLVVDRQSPSSLGVHVREGALRQLRPFLRVELAHGCPVRPGPPARPSGRTQITERYSTRKHGATGDENERGASGEALRGHPSLPYTVTPSYHDSGGDA